MVPFWETRKLTPDAFDLPARTAFINAVAGQPAQGYERVVIEQGEAPSFIIDAIKNVEDTREQRKIKIDTSTEYFPDSIPKLAANVELKNEPILENNEFVRSYVIYKENRMVG